MQVSLFKKKKSKGIVWVINILLVLWLLVVYFTEMKIYRDIAASNFIPSLTKKYKALNWCEKKLYQTRQQTLQAPTRGTHYHGSRRPVSTDLYGCSLPQNCFSLHSLFQWQNPLKKVNCNICCHSYMWNGTFPYWKQGTLKAALVMLCFLHLKWLQQQELQD